MINQVQGAPHKCILCEKKNIVRSYMSSCNPCAEKKEVCAKCLKPYEKEEELT